ncbi:T-cell receptor alpha chain V region RL-5 [Takifugu flavidus]|nr:T-cell receptor alpha chain V region RL-5 [Takifugu flavidus]
MAAEDQTVTLDCHYTSTATDVYIFWYKQDGTSRPQFILNRFTFGKGKTEDEFKERFSSTLNPTMKSAPLKIQELQLSDSAVYYCALRPTVTGSSRRDVMTKFSSSCPDHFFWYHQYPGEAPEFLLYISGSNLITWSEALRSRPKFSSNESRDRVDLQVSSAAVPDSAVYDCAVRPRVTGNPQPVYNNTAPSSWKPSSHQRAT